jgi:protein involved in polysaccharide export with SLBB domain
MANYLRAVRALSLYLLTLLVAFGDASASEYRLGPRDKIKIRVHEWRPARGELYEWPGLSGEFVVSPTGTVSLPLIGDVPATGKSTEEVASSISSRLQTKAGLSQAPSTSLEVVEFRPFYIVGAVERPGEYPSRPDLTVIQAIAMSGGLLKGPDIGLLRLRREVTSGRGDLRVLTLGMVALVARRARLSAELTGAQTVDYPPDLVRQRSDPQVEAVIKQEQTAFLTRRDSFLKQIDASVQLKTLMQQEIKSLREQVTLKDKQIASLQKELQTVSSLVEKGMAVATRQFSLDRALADYEANRLQLISAILRAQEALNTADRAILDLESRRKTEAALAVRETQTLIDENEAKQSTVRNLIYESEVVTPAILGQMFDTFREPPKLIIARQSSSGLREEEVSETAIVQPGDLIKVVPSAWQERILSAESTSDIDVAPANSASTERARTPLRELGASVPRITRPAN